MHLQLVKLFFTFFIDIQGRIYHEALSARAEGPPAKGGPPRFKKKILPQNNRNLVSRLVSVL